MNEPQSPAIDDDGRRSQADDPRFRLIFESGPGALIVVDAAGTIELANIEAGRVFGYFPGELVGRTIDTLLPDRPDLASRVALFVPAQQRPLGAGRVVHARYKNGTQFSVEIGCKSIETPAGTRTLIAVVDVAGRKSREASADGMPAEADVLLREAHHRARSNLQIIQSLLDWQSPRIRDRAAAELLRESHNRIHSVVLVHQTLSQVRGAADIDFNTFLSQLVPALMSSYGRTPKPVHLKMNASGVSLPSKPAVPCALLVTELVSNAMKHAFRTSAGTIEIEFVKKSGPKYQLSVADDGVGLPESVEIDNAATPGLQLVGLLAKQLKAEMTVQRARPTRFEFRFDVISGERIASGAPPR